MKTLLFLLFTTATLLGQGGSYCSYMTGDPRLYANKFGLVAYYGLFDTNSITLNGAGESKVLDKTGNTNDLLQSTAANQPLVSRNDNKGNLMVQSEAFSTTWNRTKLNAFGATDTGAAGAGSFANTARTTDPLGGNTADFIQEDTQSGYHYVSQATANLSPASYILSICAKDAGRSWLAIEPDNSTQTYFDLTNGVVGAVGLGCAGAITSLGNGWYRCSVTWTSAGGTGRFTGFEIAAGDSTASYAGDNTSGLYLWGASLRQSTWDSDYIATTSTIAVPGLNGKTTAYFDGANHYLKTAAFTLNQPTTVIWVGKQVTWTANDALFDGNAAGSGKLYQHTATPSIALNAGSDTSDDANLTVGSYKIVTSILNNASSSIQVNNSAATTGTAGANNPGGFTLGAVATPTGYANIQASQVLLFNRALLTNEVTAIHRWAQGIGGTALAF